MRAPRTESGLPRPAFVAAALTRARLLGHAGHLLVGLATPKRAILQVFLCGYQMSTKYTTGNGATRQVWDTIDRAVAPRLPGPLGSAYSAAKGMLSKMPT